MRDIHCHILPAVDDGSPDLATSLEMLEAAKAAGVTSITCTPHCRSPYFDFDAMWRAFHQLRDAADGFPLQMGFEVNHRMLTQLGPEWVESLRFDGSNEFLLELAYSALPTQYRLYLRTIATLQSMGYEVIIAHPERYAAIQRSTDLAQELVNSGCKLQASATFIDDRLFGKVGRTAKRLFKQGLYTYLASDAHGVEQYAQLTRARQAYGSLLTEPA